MCCSKCVNVDILTDDVPVGDGVQSFSFLTPRQGCLGLWLWSLFPETAVCTVGWGLLGSS